MSKKFRDPVGHALRQLTSEPLSSVPFSEVVDQVVRSLGIERDDKTVVEIQTAFRWLRGQNLGHSQRKGHWALTRKGWEDFAPKTDVGMKGPEVVWSWVSGSVPCFGQFRHDLDTCKACLCRRPCREDLLIRLAEWGDTMDVTDKLGLSGDYRSVLDAAKRHEMITPAEYLIQISCAQRLSKKKYQMVVMGHSIPCLLCNQEIESGVPLAQKGLAAFHILCAAMKEDK